MHKLETTNKQLQQENSDYESELKMKQNEIDKLNKSLKSVTEYQEVKHKVCKLLCLIIEGLCLVDFNHLSSYCMVGIFEENLFVKPGLFKFSHIIK